MIERIISGGQTGADQAGLRAAKACGIATGGYAPRGWLTEQGAAPWLADYGLIECPDPAFERPEGMPLWQWNGILYTSRTRRNARESGVTLWFDFPKRDQRGYLATSKHAANIICITKGNLIHSRLPAGIVENFGGLFNGVANIAGNRESKSPGIGAWVEAYLTEVFRLLKENAG